MLDQFKTVRHISATEKEVSFVRGINPYRAFLHFNDLLQEWVVGFVMRYQRNRNKHLTWAHVPKAQYARIIPDIIYQAERTP